MKQFTFYILLFFLLINSKIANAQANFIRQQNVPVQVGANILKMPWAGGLNFPLFSEFDFNQDGIKDLFIFERVNNRIICLVNQGTPNQVDYVFAPQYFHMFPPAQYWAFTHDYNCDGRNDFFTLSSTYNGIKVYRNDSINSSSFQFTLITPQLKCQYPSTFTNIPAAYGLFPAFSDIDNDGDMDILALSSSVPGLIEFDKNISVESGFGCDSLKFQYATSCWGNMLLPVSANCGNTGISCRTGWEPDSGPKTNLNNDNYRIDYYDQSDAARHDDTMSCICIIDIDNDNDKDLLIGGLGDNNEQMTRNGGTPFAAVIDSVDCLWPNYSTPV
ncbi:MAG: VCBS repeat-containing protein, partial [Bacteroidia bacterium]|nr:VCBS repeat-containing protein [Bacteroidia bacterium]